MRLQRENDSLVFSLNASERLLLVHILRELIGKYQLKPHELDAPTAAAWYSSRGCAKAGMSDEETREWLEGLHNLKRGACLQRLEEWVAQLQEEREAADSKFSVLHSAPPQQFALRILAGHAPTFVTAINDYRLAAAARHGIGETEMNAHSLWQLTKLVPPRQKAVLEIHFLAWLIEETLRVLETA